ncbi:MAG: dihydrofolate reductase [Clostridia bacterium]|nr:dihydrofolate reductase [Clostridia bacterium]
MNLVVAVDKNWGIGYKGDLLARIKADLRNFAVLTRERAVVLGSNTLATFPGGKVLKGRVNIVLNPDPEYAPEGAVVAHSIDEAVKAAEEYGSDNVWVIGGMSIYRQMLPYCRYAFVTKIDADFKKDAFFPDLDKDPGWHLIFEGGRRESEPSDTLGELSDGTVPEKVNYSFTVYSSENK